MAFWLHLMLARDGSFTSEAPQAAVHSQSTGYHAYLHACAGHVSARCDLCSMGIYCAVCEWERHQGWGGGRRSSINILSYLYLPWHQLLYFLVWTPANTSAQLSAFTCSFEHQQHLLYSCWHWLPGSNRTTNTMRGKELRWPFYFKAELKHNYLRCSCTLCVWNFKYV